MSCFQDDLSSFGSLYLPVNLLYAARFTDVSSLNVTPSGNVSATAFAPSTPENFTVYVIVFVS